MTATIGPCAPIILCSLPSSTDLVVEATCRTLQVAKRQPNDEVRKTASFKSDAWKNFGLSRTEKETGNSLQTLPNDN